MDVKVFYKKRLSMLLAVCLFVSVAPVSAWAEGAGAVCKIGEDKYANLDFALEKIGDGESKIIELLAGINYDKGMVIKDKSVVFALNGNNLNIVNKSGVGLQVTNGTVGYTGEGEFNVTGTTAGVYVNHANSVAAVTHAEGINYGVNASMGKITVHGHVVGAAVGAVATNFGGEVTVRGNVIARNEDGTGAKANPNAKVIIDGMIDAENYIKIGEATKNKDEGTFDSDKPAYLKYGNASDGIVWVRNKPAEPDPTHTVALSGVGTGATGAGSYIEGATVQITAGSRSGYTFAGWTSPDVAIANAGSKNASFSMPGKAVTITANWSDNGGDAGSSADPTPTAPVSTPNVDAAGVILQGVITAEVQSALSGGTGTAVLLARNAQSISPETIRALANAGAGAGRRVMLHADTVSGGGVQSRIYLNPALLVGAAQSIHLGAYTSESRTAATRELFETYFNNSVRVVHFDQQGSFGACLEVAAYMVLEGMSTRSLMFYSYDEASNTYRRITMPAYWLDANGYLHFHTSLAGSVIITDKPLTPK